MREPKPLSKERREQIENWLTPSGGGFRVAQEARFVRELMAAEEFWRVAVRKFDPVIWELPFYKCEMCGSEQPNIDADLDMKHNPDCPWLLAQE